MRLLLVCMALICMSSASAEMVKRCGSVDPTEGIKKLIDIKVEAAILVQGAQKALQTRQGVVIPVVMHAVNAEVSEDVIAEQIDVLNENYESVGIEFELLQFNSVKNPNWDYLIMSMMGEEEQDMKSQLRVGGEGILNIYIVQNLPALGWATPPYFLFEGSKEALDADGVVIEETALPGGLPPFNQGKTLVHEVGHWMGLFHTFQDGCSGEGDFIDDTVAHSEPTSGCPAFEVSDCDGTSMVPINNHMNYADDVCLTEFTDNQITRMQDVYLAFRQTSGGLVSPKLTP